MTNAIQPRASVGAGMPFVPNQQVSAKGTVPSDPSWDIGIVRRVQNVGDRYLVSVYWTVSNVTYIEDANDLEPYNATHEGPYR